MEVDPHGAWAAMLDTVSSSADSGAEEEGAPANAWDNALADVSDDESDGVGGQWADALAVVPDEGSGSGGEAQGVIVGEGPQSEATEESSGEGAVAPHPDALALVPAIVPSVGTLSVLSRRTPDEDLDQAELRCCTHYVLDKVHIGSLSAEASQLGVDRKNCEPVGCSVLL